jgi:hypothetical protein
MKFSNTLFIGTYKTRDCLASTTVLSLAPEIMLQQTRVAQGTPYFLAFQLHFPLFLIWLQ